MPVFEWRSTVPFSADEVYAWHTRPGAFERLSPPWHSTRVIERTGDMEHGGTLVFEYHNGPLRGRWVAVHGDAEPGRRFSDRQLHGPFEAWEHTHSFIPDGPGRSVIEDHIEFRLPLGAAGDVFGGLPAEPLPRASLSLSPRTHAGRPHAPRGRMPASRGCASG